MGETPLGTVEQCPDATLLLNSIPRLSATRQGRRQGFGNTQTLHEQETREMVASHG